jgi:carboxyl-terminal processing protease
MRRRLAGSLLLIAALLCLGSASSLHAQDVPAAPYLGTVQAAYNDLLGLSYLHPDPKALLQAGWSAIPEGLLPGAPQPPALPPLPADPQAAMQTFSAAYASYIASYQQSLNHGGTPEMVALAIADGMAQAAGESHTRLIIGDLTDLTGGAQFGLGLQTTARPPIIVTTVADNSPASSAAVHVGDQILAVNGRQPQTSLDLAPPLATIQSGVMMLTVQRGSQQLQLKIAPGGFNFPPLASKLLSGGVGYLRVNDFGVNNAYFDNLTRFTSDLDQRLDDFDAHGATAIVLDLRDFSGSDLAAEAALLGRFLPEGTLTVREFDNAGHQAFGAVSGAMRARQLPMVVLVNSGTAAAAEEAAAVLRENGRAIVVGAKTAGSLAATRVVPISENAALQIALAQATTAANTVIDGTGVAIDLAAPDTRTADDVRAGRDAPLDAAIKAIGRAPAPPAPGKVSPPATILAVHQLLANYVPATTGILLSDGTVAQLEPLDASDLGSPSELAASDLNDPDAMVKSLRAHGWLGRHAQTFNVIINGVQSELVVTLDVYQTNDGASAALHENDYPGVLQPAPAAAQVADESVGYSGQWLRNGWSVLGWRRANVVATATFATPPASGSPSADVLVGAATAVDTELQRYPVTSDTFKQNMQALLGAPPTAAPVAAAATSGAAPASAVRTAPTTISAATQPAVAAAQPQSAPAQTTKHDAGGPISTTFLIAVLCVLALVAMGGYAVRRA